MLPDDSELEEVRLLELDGELELELELRCELLLLPELELLLKVGGGK